jgi:UDP-N-acetylglucosamine 2-epimerase (non-hydrolysing)
MRSIKVVVSFGTRPEAIKLAPLIKCLKQAADFTTVVCSTGQHDQMLKQVVEFFDIQPDYDFKVMRKNQQLSEVAAAVMCQMDIVVRSHHPDVLIVQGDTTSAFAAALAGFYAGVPVGHVEAGLRTYNPSAPFPEEGNRQLITRLAAIHFAPTEANRETLINELIPEQFVHVTGNTVVDALLWTADALGRDGIAGVASEIGTVMAALDRAARVVLVTGHRRESFGSGLESVCRALLRIASSGPDVHVVYPVHLNPKVFDSVHRILAEENNIHLLPPMSYPAFVWLMKRADIIITDSGGIQEEAPSLKRPVLVTRNVTERQEAVRAGVVKVVGLNEENIVSEVKALLSSETYYAEFIRQENPYGDGRASEKIVSILRSRFSNAGEAK